MNVMINIYTLSDPNTKRIVYVGSTKLSLKERLQKHLSNINSRKVRNDKKSLWLRNLLLKGTKPTIESLELCKKEDSEFLEEYWIYQIKAWGFDLLNSTINGKSFLGMKFSKEHREAISKAHKGKTKSIDHIIKIIDSRHSNRINKLNQLKNI